MLAYSDLRSSLLLSFLKAETDHHERVQPVVCAILSNSRIPTNLRIRAVTALQAPIIMGKTIARHTAGATY